MVRLALNAKRELFLAATACRGLRAYISGNLQVPMLQLM